MTIDELIFQGDDTSAFGGVLLRINLYNPLDYPIKKAIFVCGCIIKEFDNPTFPIDINFNNEETEKLRSVNQCFLIVYDMQGKQKTCRGTITIKAQKGVLPNDCRQRRFNS